MIKRKIMDAIEQKVLQTGAMGTENVSVSLSLTDEEKEKFLSISYFDGGQYWWECVADELTMHYVEDGHVTYRRELNR